MFFDIGAFKLAALVVLAVLIFGPDKLPKLISEATGFVRKVRQFADSAKQEVRDGLGPGFQDLEFEDLNPKTFVHKQLAAHGDGLGLTEARALKDALSRDAADAAASVRDTARDPLGRVDPEEVTPRG